MTSNLLRKCLDLGPIRRCLIRQGNNPVTRHLFERLSGAGKIYPSLEQAQEGIRRHRPETCGHFDTKLIGSNFRLSSEKRLSDYPVLFWLLQILREEKIGLFDFGGGVGQTFINFTRLLPPENLDRWMIQDLPEVIAQVDRQQFAHQFPGRLEFTTELGDAKDCNALLAAGSLHYWNGSIAEFFEQLGTKPRHFIVNRSPMPEAGEPFFTVQEGVDWAVPCQVRSLAGLWDELKVEGYSLVDSWIDNEKRLQLPWLPAFSSDYRGAYFRRED